MKINVKKIRRIAMMLGLIMMLAVVFSACVNLDEVEEIMDNSINFGEGIGNEDTSDVKDLTPGENQSIAPTVTGIVYMDPLTIAITGTCEEGSVIEVTCAGSSATTNSKDGYFVIEFELPSDTNLVSITAQQGDLEKSKSWDELLYKNATATGRLDGMSVSVGVNSSLYFDYMAENANGSNLYTASQLNAIRNYVSNKVTEYNNKAVGQTVEMIYVLVPDATTIYGDVFPEGAVEKPTTTVYDQVSETLKNTRATVIDMRDVFNGLLADETFEAKDRFYRTTDSALTDYGAYLTYREIMNTVSARFPNAAARGEEEFTWSEPTNVLGGNMVIYRELDNAIVTEDIITATPNFSLDLGTNGAGTTNIASLKKYVDAESGNYTYYDTINPNDDINGVGERLSVDTKRPDADLPTVAVYRDYSSFAFTDILLERFEKSVLVRSNDFNIEFTGLGSYAGAGDEIVDYVIVVLSEQSMDTAFAKALE